MSSGSTSMARSECFSTSSWMRASNLTAPTTPTVTPFTTMFELVKVAATGVNGKVVYRNGQFCEGYGTTVKSGRFLHAGAGKLMKTSV